MKGFLLIFAATVAGTSGLEATNYDISRNNQLGSPTNAKIKLSYSTQDLAASDSTLSQTVSIDVQGGVESENYKLSRRLVDGTSNQNGFGIRDFLDFLLAGAYGQYYPNYPGGYNPGGNYPGGNYPGGNYPGGNYPGQYQGYPGGYPGPAGPPGAHPGCPLCDSSVYSYCSYKQAHDACCCDNPSYMPFTCRKSSCAFLYANSCQEYNLISSCCCVDLYKNGAVPPGPLPAVPVAA